MQYIHLVSNLLIVIFYFVFALQTFVAWQSVRGTEGANGLLKLSVVFVFCAFAGYFSEVINFPSLFDLINHVILVVASFWLVRTNQAAMIMRQLTS